MNIETINQSLQDTGISVIGTYVHSKASESYVDVMIGGTNDAILWDGSIPYRYRRTGLWLDTEQEVADYLCEIRECFMPKNIQKWADSERKYWNENFRQSPVTTPIFLRLLSMEWVYGHEFPLNPDGTPNQNLQRRIQQIKDNGYTVASKPEGRIWKRKLLPLPRRSPLGYETISKDLRARIVNVLNAENVYELSSANRAGLLPDHKFPEIRWDADTRRENPDNMTEDEIRAKFQLLDNQRNEQKREVCRRCLQTGERGILFGINFFYAGGGRWPDAIPQRGIAAEQGCIGCGWYDVRAWRQVLNERLTESPEP